MRTSEYQVRMRHWTSTQTNQLVRLQTFQPRSSHPTLACKVGITRYIDFRRFPADQRATGQFAARPASVDDARCGQFRLAGANNRKELTAQRLGETRSLTHMATRSMPTPSTFPVSMVRSLVPTPSVYNQYGVFEPSPFEISRQNYNQADARSICAWRQV
jgi:hypothetical protein